MRRDIVIHYFTLILLIFISSFILWTPFLFRFDTWFGLKIENSDFLHIYKQFDGPLYIIPAKTFYDINQIDAPGRWLIVSLPIGPKYFAAHLPIYPVFINLFSRIFGYLKSMIFTNILFTTFLAILFYHLVSKLKLTSKPLILTALLFFLPRFLVIRSTGAPESMFIFFILLSLFMFEEKNYWLAGITGALATMTKTPGILLFPAYIMVFLENRGDLKHKLFTKIASILLIPLGLLLVFTIYGVQMKDFFAYFHSGDNIHLVSPFSVFNFQKTWVGTGWLDDVIFYFFLYLITVLSLKNFKYRSFFYFGLVFFIGIIFVQHRDIARYSLPLWPLSLIAFQNFFTSRKFLFAFVLLLPAIYLYAWNILVSNAMPIADWTPFL